MLLGVLLAVLSGILVIYIVSQATSNAGAQIQLVVAKQAIPSGTVLGASNIQTYFGVENYPASIVPAGAYVYTNQDALDVHLNQTVVVTDIEPGDVLLSQDPRFQAVGSVGANGKSITYLSPNLLPTGDVLFAFNYASPSNATQSFINPGDTVDILAMECSAPFTTTSGQCVDQTTLQNVVVYATFSGSVVLVLSPQKAKELRILANTGTLDFVIKKPGDTGQDTSSAVTAASVASAFGYP
jgi:Flp pilus assembly protein CpaB